MSEGRDRAEWNRAAAIRFQIASAFSSSRSRIADFHPYYQTEEPSEESTPGVKLDITSDGGMELFAQAMVPNYREHKRKQTHAIS